jgi:hypothetical protein
VIAPSGQHDDFLAIRRHLPPVNDAHKGAVVGVVVASVAFQDSARVDDVFQQLSGRGKSVRWGRLRLWRPAQALGTHAKQGPSTGHSAVGLRQGREMSPDAEATFHRASCTLGNQVVAASDGPPFRQECRPTRVCRTPGAGSGLLAEPRDPVRAVVVQLAGQGGAVWGHLHAVRHVGIRRRSWWPRDQVLRPSYLVTFETPEWSGERGATNSGT